MISGDLGITIDQALALEKRHAKNYTILYKSGLIYEHLDLNLDNPILKDKRIRQALILALDRAAISKQLFETGNRCPHQHQSFRLDTLGRCPQIYA